MNIIKIQEKNVTVAKNNIFLLMIRADAEACSVEYEPALGHLYNYHPFAMMISRCPLLDAGFGMDSACAD